MRRERGAYAVYGRTTSPARAARGRSLRPSAPSRYPAEALALLGSDGAHLQDLSLALRRELEGIVYLGPLPPPRARLCVEQDRARDVGNDGHQAIDALLANALLPSEHQGSVLRSVSHWLQRMGMAEQLSVRAVGRSGRYELLVHHDGVVANLRDVGVGVSQVLPVLAVAYCAPPGSTVLLEEPEIHLHPLAQAVLAEVFAEVSQQRQVQFWSKRIPSTCSAACRR